MELRRNGGVKRIEYGVGNWLLGEEVSIEIRNKKLVL